METFQRVTHLIEKLNKDWNRAGASRHFSRIDKDILIDDIRSLYELVHELETGAVSENNTEKQQNHSPEIAYPEPQSAEPKTEEVPDQPQAEPEPEIPQPEEETSGEHLPETRDDLKSQDPHEIELEIVTGSDETFRGQNNSVEQDESQEEPFEADEMKPELPEKPKPKTPVSTGEAFKASKTLADVYQRNGDNSIAARMQHNRISDIKAAIGINEKFLFINEIFKGNTGDYKKAIERLNSMSHYHEAIDYIDQIKNENEVKNEEATAKLVEIIKRKYS